MKRTKLIAVGVLLLVLTVAWFLLPEYWRYRHYYSVRKGIDAWIERAQPLLADLQRYKVENGAYPATLSDLGENLNYADDEWEYTRLEDGVDYELFRTHSHWVSSFNGLAFSPDGVYRDAWTSVDYKRRSGWMYAIGAQSFYRSIWP